MKGARYLFPMAFSVGAMVAGLLAIIQASEGHFVLSAQLIMLSMVLDGLDGTLARRLNATSKFGAEFDTFVDLTSFGIAPALLAWWSTFHAYGGWGLMFIGTMVLSGMSRLARFRVVDPQRGSGGFLGLPITVNAGWVAICVYLAGVNQVGDLDLSFGAGLPAWFCWGVSMLLVLLQVSQVHYGKPTKNLAFLMGAVAVTLALFLENLGTAAAMWLAFYGLYYAFASPWMDALGAWWEAHRETDQ